MKKKQAILMILLLLLLLMGCETTQLVPPVIEKLDEPYHNISQASEAESKETYYYMLLNEEEKLLYEQIYESIVMWHKDYELTSLDGELIEKIFQLVMNDHPEIFYVSGYQMTRYTQGDELIKITFSATYTMDQMEAENRQILLANQIEEWLKETPKNGDEYDRVKYVYEKLVCMTDYSLAAVDNQNICSVFLHQESVCQGYAKACQYLLEQMGISAALVTGEVINGQAHAWNLVKVNGNYYYVDPTWGDASYQLTGSGSKLTDRQLPEINYDYLCVTTDLLKKTHIIYEEEYMPVCSAMNDNYYVREGLYFETADETQLASIFEKAILENRSYVTIKCSDRAVYDSMVGWLIVQQGIFQYINTEDGNIAYTQDDQNYSIGFWL